MDQWQDTWCAIVAILRCDYNLALGKNTANYISAKVDGTKWFVGLLLDNMLLDAYIGSDFHTRTQVPIADPRCFDKVVGFMRERSQ